MRVFFCLFVAPPVFYFAATADAHAYIDPGTGSILLQSIVAALAVGASFVAGFWQKIRSFFLRSKPEANRHNLTVEKPSEGASQK
jgi:hypothetical protein